MVPQERTLALVKHEIISFSPEILARMDLVGERRFDSFCVNVPLEVWEKHYEIHKGKGFYRSMTEDSAGKPAHLVIYQAYPGEKVLAQMRRLIGSTNPFEALPGTIRHDYRGLSSELIKVDLGEEVFLIRNLVHATDSPESFQREAKVWSRFLGVDLSTI